ncbi:hypothetical protein AYI68_g3482 [Smittium mucronatum]|uniref:Uncharacterized protein n=1 Tax=Smittium mucronatum TaxID=133383 RepID=A0A1R0GZT6_9FUNG|nr:hypothetical protein AYI68_g3482 [Smittium mucronatum]
MFFEADPLYQLEWYKYSHLNCCFIVKDEATLGALLLVLSTPSYTRDFSAGIAPILRLSTLHPLLPVLTTLSVCKALMVGIISKKLTWGLGQKIKESPSKEDTRSSITGFLSKFTDGSNSSLKSRDK